jgi:PAS domain S-box-containing protein
LAKKTEPDVLSLPLGDGGVAALIRAYDWPTSPLGPSEGWSPALRIVLRTVLANPFPAVVCWGPELITFYNDAYRRLLGNKPDALGQPFLDVWAEARDMIAPLLDRALAGDACRFENAPFELLRHGIPEQAFFDFSFSPVYDQDGLIAGVLNTAVETTERVFAEQRREADAGRQRRLFEQAPGFITILNGPDHVFEFANAAYRRLIGERNPVGRTVREALPELEGQGFFELLDQVYTTGERFVAERSRISLHNPGGPPEARVLDFIYEPVTNEAGQVTGIFVEGHDVTDASHAEAELRENEARLKLVIDGARDYAIITFDADRRITSWSPGAEVAFGGSEAERVGRSADEIFTPEDRRDGAPVEEVAIAIREGVAPDLRWHQRNDGTRVFMNGFLRPLPMEADGTPRGFIKIARDETARLSSETALRDTEQRYRLAAKATNDAIWDWNLGSDHILWNEAVENLFGYAPRDVGSSGAWWKEHIHPDDRARVVAGIQGLIDGPGDHWGDEYRFRRADGSFADVLDRGHVIRDEGGRAVRMIGAMLDLTERKRSEEQLRALNANLERKVTERALGRSQTWQLSPELMGVLNAEGFFEQSNPAWANLLGWSEAEVASTFFLDFVHPDDLPQTRAVWNAAVSRNEPALRFQNRYRSKDGAWRWLSWVAVPDEGKVYCSARDITDQKEQAAELVERTAERDRMWQTSPDLLVVLDLNGVLRRVNPAWTTILGYEEHELVGTRVDHLVHPNDVELTEEALVTASNGALPIVENRYRHKDGTFRWISWITPPPQNGAIFATGRHITAEKEAAAELELAQEALRQAQKMEAMGQLTGGVAHDFNNLLTPIVGSLDLLQRRGLGGEREQRLIAGAIQSADRAKTLVQRLLAFARRQPLQPTAVDVGRLVEGMADLLASTTGPQVRMVVEVADDLPPAKADPNQLEMALLNLGVNARDAMPDGGTLRISATRESVRSPRGALKRGHYVRLSVADTGVGMDEATLARAVEPFFSTKGIGKGTGLGLSMAHGLAAQLGGALTIQSRQGVGTNIELWLPISTTLPGHDEIFTAPAQLGKARGLALLVDDEEVVRESTADMLEEFGYQVRQADSGEGALALVARGLAPDLLVTDHLMPGMTGVDLARTLRETLPDLPVLIVSGYAEAEGIAPDLPRLTKPFRSAELEASLAALTPA